MPPEPLASKFSLEDEQLRARYRHGLQRIVDEARWCEDYAMCDHVGCESAHRAWETARVALDVETALWPLRGGVRSSRSSRSGSAGGSSSTNKA